MKKMFVTFIIILILTLTFSKSKKLLVKNNKVNSSLRPLSVRQVQLRAFCLKNTKD